MVRNLPQWRFVYVTVPVHVKLLADLVYDHKYFEKALFVLTALLVVI